jgi:calmodulin
VKQAPTQKALLSQFKLLDKDNTGVISKQNLTDAVHEANLDLDEKEISSIIEQVDYETNGTISYTEFLAATMPLQSYVTEEKLKEIFS